MNAPHPTAAADSWFGHGVALAAALARQGGIQLAMALGGILIVRTLSADAYAHYAIAFSAVTAATAISNSGIIDGLSALAAGHLQDEPRLGRIVGAALKLRQRIGGMVALVLLPALALLLWRDGAGVPEIATLVSATALVNLLELHFGISLVVPWLRGFGARLQNGELCGALVRLAAIVVLLRLAPLAPMALLSAVAGVATQLWLLRRWYPRPSVTSERDPEAEATITRLVRRQWPNELNALIQAQAGVWLLSIFAGTWEVALYAAMGRVSILFVTVLSALHRTMAARYAVAQELPTIERRYLATLSVYALLAVTMCVCVAIFPTEILWLLGPRYAGAVWLLDLSALAAAVAALATLTLWLNAMRGWIMPAILWVPIQIGWLVTLTALFGARSPQSVLFISIGMSLAQTVANVIFFRLRLRSFTPPTA